MKHLSILAFFLFTAFARAGLRYDAAKGTLFFSPANESTICFAATFRADGTPSTMWLGRGYAIDPSGIHMSGVARLTYANDSLDVIRLQRLRNDLIAVSVEAFSKPIDSSMLFCTDQKSFFSLAGFPATKNVSMLGYDRSTGIISCCFARRLNWSSSGTGIDLRDIVAVSFSLKDDVPKVVQAESMHVETPNLKKPN